MARYLFHCSSCDTDTDLDYPIGTRPDQAPCPVCAKVAEYVLVPPGIMTHSYLDGQKRKGYQDIREASKLNVEAASTDDPQKKKEIHAEISNKLKVDIRKDSI